MTTTEMLEAPLPMSLEPGARTPSYRPQSWALAVSGLRCLLTYVIGPFLLPVTGALVVPSLGIGASLLAIVLDVRALRRIRRRRDPRVTAMSALYASLIVLVTVLLVVDAWRLVR